MPNSSTVFATLMTFAFQHPWAFALLALLGLGIGVMIGRFWVRSEHLLKAEAIELSYAQALQDSYIIRRVVESTSDGLVVLSMEGHVIWCNPTYCKMMGRSPEEIVGRNPLEYALPKEDQVSAETIANYRFNPTDDAESGLHLWRNQRANGEEFWNQINGSFHTAPDGTDYAILSCRDVTEQVERERELEITRIQLEFMVGHDELTGIGNRTTLIAFTNAALADASNTGRRIGMIRIDLDRFKEINDTYGHAVGDAMLTHMAKVFASKLRDTDHVARIGGDEFVAVCPDIGNFDDLKNIATTLKIASARAFEFQDITLKGSASFGIALSEPDATSAEDLLLHSDFALYETKRISRGNVTIYGPELHRRRMVQSHRRRELVDALRNDKLSFHFQPTLSLNDGAISGFETLVRWDHPVEGMITPDAILPMAEELGLMAELDMAAMRAGVEMKLALRDAGFPDLHIALNASAAGLTNPAYFATLNTLIRKHGILPYHICVEVLETVMFEDGPNAALHGTAIAQLHQAGFPTLLDDFGIGHAGLSHLAKLDLSGVKADRSLVSDILTDAVAHRIVSTIAALCNDLDLWLVAEGVEDIETAACLRDMGVGIIQGYWIAKPLPADQVVDWITSYRVAPLPLGPTTIDTSKALPPIKKDLAS